MWICWILVNGHVSRERVAEPVAEVVLSHMRAAYPKVAWWLLRDGDGLEWRVDRG